jgi:tRNA threonylcarbamoyladenosine biosynthesis protein TsaE
MPSTICVRSPDAATTQRLGEWLGALLAPGDVVALLGPLGAGKTCFVQGVARGLGVDPSVPVTSPTFTLVGEYPARIPLRHADFYRIESEDRLFELGFDDLLDGRGVLLVEWADRWPRALPRDLLEIQIEPLEGTERRLSFTARGARAEVLCGALRREAETSTSLAG